MQERIGRVRGWFAEADRQTRALASRTGMACPPLCGACCLSPEIDASIAEMLPLAVHLMHAGRGAAMLDELERRAQAGEQVCALFAPLPAGPLDPPRGRCTAYEERPLVCRLFAFSARRTRTGATELVACRTLRAATPDVVERACELTAAGEPAPVLADFAHALAADLPGEGAVRLPINEALRLALERVLLAQRFGALESVALVGAPTRAEPPDVEPGAGPDPEDEPGSDGTRPTPSRPPRRAA